MGLDLDPQRLGTATPAAGAGGAAAGGAAAANPQHHTGASGPTLLQQLGLEGVPDLQNGGVGPYKGGVDGEEGEVEQEVQLRGAGWRALVELARGAALVVTGKAARLGVTVGVRCSQRVSVSQKELYPPPHQLHSGGHSSRMPFPCR